MLQNVILIKYNLSIFFFSAFGVVSKNSLSKAKSSRFYPMISSGSFIVLHLTFKSTVQFELIFVKDINLYV